MATDTVQLETKVGPQTPQADGVVLQYPRGCKTGELGTSQCHAPHYEAASRGKLFMASNQSVVTFGTALTATGVTFHLYNPVGSPVNLVVLQTQITVLTAGTGGHIVYAANVNPLAAAPATNTELVVRNAKLDLAPGFGKAYSVTTLPAAPVAVRPFIGAITAAGIGAFVDYVDGAIILGPNTCLSIQGITIVGTGLIGMLWEEVPIQS